MLQAADASHLSFSRTPWSAHHHRTLSLSFSVYTLPSLLTPLYRSCVCSWPGHGAHNLTRYFSRLLAPPIFRIYLNSSRLLALIRSQPHEYVISIYHLILEYLGGGGAEAAGVGGGIRKLAEGAVGEGAVQRREVLLQ